MLIAGGMTHGTSSMPRHLRWPLAGMLWTKWATTKPMIALKMTAVMANRQDCSTTIQNVSRLNRNSKLPKPTKLVIDFVQRRQMDRIEGRVDHQDGDQQDQRQRHQEGDGRFALHQLAQAGASVARQGAIAVVGRRCRPWPCSVLRCQLMLVRKTPPRDYDGEASSSIRFSALVAHEAFDFARRPIQRLLHRLALEVADRHLGLDALVVDLLGDLVRRGRRGDREDLVVVRVGVVVERALRRPFLGPGLEGRSASRTTADRSRRSPPPSSRPTRPATGARAGSWPPTCSC